MYLKKLSHIVYEYLINYGYNTNVALVINVLINLAILAIFLYIVDRIARVGVIRSFGILSKRTKTNFDDFIFESRFPKYVAHLLPYLILVNVIPFIFFDVPRFQKLLILIFDLYLVLLVVRIIRSFTNGFNMYLKGKEAYKDKPIDSFVQTFHIVVWCIAGVFIFSILTGKSIVTFLTAVGAASAIVLFVFKDTILGFVASIQVSTNDIVRIGDWITQDSYGADGTVTEINLTTVKVKNFDNTFTTIPTYFLVSNSFKNWRGMVESGGRRFRRTINIKQESVKLLKKTDLDRLAQIQILEAYITTRQRDIDGYNLQYGYKNDLNHINGRNQTNLGAFRKYCDLYITSHPAINKELDILVRHLPSTQYGLPIEIYGFSKEKQFVQYEHIVSDIMEHLIASLSFFELEILETPYKPPLLLNA